MVHPQKGDQEVKSNAANEIVPYLITFHFTCMNPCLRIKELLDEVFNVLLIYSKIERRDKKKYNNTFSHSFHRTEEY